MLAEPFRLIVLAALLVGLPGCSGGREDSAAAAQVITDGKARFQVISSSLLRLEYAEDGRFEDMQTLTVTNREPVSTVFETRIENGERVIQTNRFTLRYRLDSGPFGEDNLHVDMAVGDRQLQFTPSWAADSNPAPLGGWRRSLDYEMGNPIALHQGIFSRDGWALLNDSSDVLVGDAPPGFTVRAHDGAYQDGYLFAYGQDFRLALADLRHLTGATPLLPRSSFGVWFSHYWPYTDETIKALVQDFRDHAVPLDTFSIDTDFKRRAGAANCAVINTLFGTPLDASCSWNGWDWDDPSFPDPADFIDWAHANGLNLSLNVHPSISAADPHYAQTIQTAGPLTEDFACRAGQFDPVNGCYVFDWTNADHLQSYWDLHAPFEAQGADFWWLDWCCDATTAVAPGLTADTWINRQYFQRSQARGSRWPAFSRIGASLQEGWAGIGGANGAAAFAEHTQTIHFTGDTCGPAAMLAEIAAFTAAESAIGMSYVSHDIGSFHGDNTLPCELGRFLPTPLTQSPHLPDDLYVRWVQLGTFQPLSRLHSQHGERLPWQYPGQAEAIAADFLRLREALVPYLYTTARQAHDTGVTMVRPLYLEWPAQDEAYAHASEFLLGEHMLIATVAELGQSATVEVWIPPGTWYEYFTGEAFTGPTTVQREIPLERYPVFVRAGAILPTQPPRPYTPAQPPEELIVSVWPGNGTFSLYDDAGRGLDYLDGAFSWTPMRSQTSGNACRALAIDAAIGSFPQALSQRSWTVRFVGMPPPDLVRINGQPINANGGTASWSYDAVNATLSVDTGPHSSMSAVTVEAGGAGC